MPTVSHQPVKEPNFEGEAMKLPENQASLPVSSSAPSLVKGPIILALLTALVTILAGLYYWFVILQTDYTIPVTTAMRPTAEQNNEPESTTAEADISALTTVSSSDELDAIASDLEATDLESLDAELLDIQAELDASAILE